MAKTKDNAATQGPAAGQNEVEAPRVAPADRKALGDYTFPHSAIPKEIGEFVAEKLGTGAGIHPARKEGGYKGKVLLNSPEFLVQAVGRSSQTAVVHRKENLEMMGSNMKWRDTNKRLGSVDVQVHYAGDKGKVYQWNRDRDDQQRMLGKAQAYAKTITSEKERTAFIANVKGMLLQPHKEKQHRQSGGEKEQGRSTDPKNRPAPGLER